MALLEIEEGAASFKPTGVDALVTSLSAKMLHLTTSEPGGLLREAMQQRTVEELDDAREAYEDTRHQSLRMKAIMDGLFPEAKQIEVVKTRLETVLSTALSSVQQIYDMEFGGERGEFSFTKVLSRVVKAKQGRPVEEPDQRKKACDRDESMNDSSFVPRWQT